LAGDIDLPLTPPHTPPPPPPPPVRPLLSSFPYCSFCELRRLPVSFPTSLLENSYFLFFCVRAAGFTIVWAWPFFSPLFPLLLLFFEIQKDKTPPFGAVNPISRAPAMTFSLASKCRLFFPSPLLPSITSWRYSLSAPAATSPPLIESPPSLLLDHETVFLLVTFPFCDNGPSPNQIDSPPVCFCFTLPGVINHRSRPLWRSPSSPEFPVSPPTLSFFLMTCGLFFSLSFFL